MRHKRICKHCGSWGEHKSGCREITPSAGSAGYIAGFYRHPLRKEEIMSIKSVAELAKGKQIIDLTGSQGNVFFLLGTASKLAKELGKDGEEIMSRMKSGDYDNLVGIFVEEFGDYVDLYR
jgi:hypothetical protein